MTLIRKCCAILLCGLAVSVDGMAQVPPPNVVKLTSSEWPPYTGKALAEQGASTAVVRAALASEGYRLDVEFFPWRRSVALVEQDSDFVGYFPEYISPEIAKGCLLSAPIGTGPLGLAERTDQPIRWDSLEDLAHYTIGVVDGYLNTIAFDRRVREQKQPVDLARDDAQNLVKLAAGRISLAVIDRRVFEYLIRHDPRVMPFASRLHFNGHLLEEKHLYICFRNSPEGEQARQTLNAGLKKIDISAVMAAALS